MGLAHEGCGIGRFRVREPKLEIEIAVGGRPAVLEPALGGGCGAHGGVGGTREAGGQDEQGNDLSWFHVLFFYWFQLFRCVDGRMFSPTQDWRELCYPRTDLCVSGTGRSILDF